MTRHLRKLLNNRRFVDRNVEKNKERLKEYYTKNAEYMCAAQKKYLSNPDNYDTLLNRKYGKGAAEHRRIQITRQNNCCAICKQPFVSRRPDLDHNHDTQQLRGALCRHCNTGIGFFKESPEILETAARYLREWAANGGSLC
jgi:hypothetical protein